MRGKELKEEDDEKDLRVFVEANMKPGKQCTTATKSANFALGQIQRAFHYRKKDYLVPLYKTLCLPWGPSLLDGLPTFDVQLAQEELSLLIGVSLFWLAWGGLRLAHV